MNKLLRTITFLLVFGFVMATNIAKTQSLYEEIVNIPDYDAFMRLVHRKLMVHNIRIKNHEVIPGYIKRF